MTDKCAYCKEKLHEGGDVVCAVGFNNRGFPIVPDGKEEFFALEIVIKKRREVFSEEDLIENFMKKQRLFELVKIKDQVIMTNTSESPSKQISIKRENKRDVAAVDLEKWIELNKEKNPNKAEMEKEYTLDEANERLKIIIKSQTK
jgi:hypothetical protein